MSDDGSEKMIPKGELDRRIELWKAQEAALKQQLADANKRVAGLEPVAARATQAEARLQEIEHATARDAVFAEAGVADARARTILLTQYNADVAGLAEGETLELKDFLAKAKEDPYLARLLDAPASQVAAAQGAAAGQVQRKPPVTTPAGVTGSPAAAPKKRDYKSEIAAAREAGDLDAAKKLADEWKNDLQKRGGLDASTPPG